MIPDAGVVLVIHAQDIAFLHCAHPISMIFGIIASVAPSVKRIVRSSIGPCPNCASPSIDQVEIANRLSLFFVPVWSFNSKEAVYCKKCRFMSAPGEYENWLVRRTLDESAQLGDHVSKQRHADANPTPTTKSCGGCGAALQDDWGFCPKCGAGT